VIVRDGRACDFLGEGRPTERLVAEPPAKSPPATLPLPLAGPSALRWLVAAAGVALLALAGYVVRRAR
jgi:LPXTG-motif cell wall-anchored protein